MALLRTNTCETSAAVGDTVDGTNSATGGNAFTYLDGTPLYTATAMHGTRAVDCTASGSLAGFGWNGLTATLTFSYRAYIRRTSTPSTTFQIIIVRDASGVMHSVNLTTANKLAVTHNGGGSTKYTSTTTLTVDTWYRVEAQATVATTTTGNMTWGLYLGDSTSPLETQTWTDLNLHTTGATNYRLGKVATTGSLGLIIDDPAFDNTTTAIGPYSSALDTQYPSSIVTAGTWTLLGTAPDIITALQDGDDTTGSRSVDDPPGTGPTTYGFGPLTASKPVTVVARHCAPAGDGNISRTYELLQSTTVKATRTVNPLPTTPTEYSFTTTSGETATISDWTALRVRVTDTKTT